jgi:hypothetical protein
VRTENNFLQFVILTGEQNEVVQDSDYPFLVEEGIYEVLKVAILFLLPVEQTLP